MANIIPEKGINFDVYINGSLDSGLAEGNFPSLEAMTSEVKGAGIAGTVDSIVLGHFQSTTITLKWRTPPANFWTLAQHMTHTLDMYAAIQHFEGSSGLITAVPLHVYTRAVTKKNSIGDLVVGDGMNSETEHEVYYMKVELNHNTVLELDKVNYIYKVHGVDYLAGVRRALGRG